MSSSLRTVLPEDSTTAQMASRILDFQPQRPEPASYSVMGDHQLPLPTRFALAFLGIFYPKSEKELVQSISMTDMDYGTVNHLVGDDDDQDVGGPWVSIDVVESPLIAYDKNQNVHKPSMSRKWKGLSWLDVISLLYLFISCSFMMYDFMCYVHAYWGVKQYTLHFVSYLTFLVQIMVVPYWCLYSKIKYNTMNPMKASILSKVSIARRINVIRQWRPAAKILSWFALLCILVCPVVGGCLRFIYDHVFRICRAEIVHTEISHWNSLLGLITYGCFCYIIFLERKSFEIETREIHRYALEQAPFQNVDGVLDRIRAFNLQYRFLRKQISIWMTFTLVVSTWGLTSHITWNYWVFSDKDIMPYYIPTVYMLNALVTAEKMTFIVVPYAIVGGLNIDHVWMRFKEDIAHCRQHKYERYWKAVAAYMTNINTRFSGDLTQTLVSTAVGVYLGLELSKTQNLGFWNESNNCNFTGRIFF